MPARGSGQRRRELGGFVFVELSRALVEVVARRRLRTVDARPELGNVQIGLQDAPLGQMLLELASQQGLFHLAKGIPRGGEPEVLRHLLGDGRGAAESAPAAHCVAERIPDLVDGEAVV